MFVQETWINKTEGYTSGDSDLYEPFTDNIKQLFKALQREYGKCISKVYVDQDKDTMPVGWVFEKSKRYDDCKQSYILQTWVTLHQSKPTKTIEYHYQSL